MSDTASATNRESTTSLQVLPLAGSSIAFHRVLPRYASMGVPADPAGAFMGFTMTPVLSPSAPASEGGSVWLFGVFHHQAQTDD